jgi:uncharacterized protein YdeI (YjbR/CyaY-like superfamily)
MLFRYIETQAAPSAGEQSRIHVLNIDTTMQIGETLTALTPDDFHHWLEVNHHTKKEIWLVIYKKASGKTGISYDESIDEALCFGWIDSTAKSIDAEKYAQRFSPRRKGGNWTEANRAKARLLIAAGRMTEAGITMLPKDF